MAAQIAIGPSTVGESGKADLIFSASLQDAFASVGMAYPGAAILPGKMVRFYTNDRLTDTAGWCRLFPDSVGAAFGCNRAGTKFVWQQRDANTPAPSERERWAVRAKAEQARQAAERARKVNEVQAVETAARILSRTTELDTAHHYVVAKGITPYAARQAPDGMVVVPVHGPGGDLQSLQFINSDGKKRFLSQARMKGGRLILGEPISDKPVDLCEGWATGCSLHEAGRNTVVVCFSGANLAQVAEDLRNQFPRTILRITGDRDPHGKGLEYAQAAAAAGTPAIVLLPLFSDGRNCGDFNDLHQAEGLDVVRHQLTADDETTVHVVVPFHAPALGVCDARDGTGSSRPLTEFGNAQRLFDLHGARLRYVHDAQSWLVWQGSAWQWDPTDASARSLAVNLPEGIYMEGERYVVDGEHFAKWARKSQQLRVANAAVKLLSDFDSLRLPLACVDADHLLVGFDQARQVINLRNGATRAAAPNDYVTKSLRVDTVGDAAKAERWKQFLDQIFDGDHALIDWLHRFCGYLLTGSTQEQVFLFCYGLGANGKSVFIELLKHICGDYACAIASETLAESRRQAGSATPELAALISARFVMCSETEDNTALAESLLKSLVSGDSMSVRRLYAAPVQFTPAFKLVMAGNHKPVVRGNDNGIWRRIRLVPFKRTFTPEERDPYLLAKLKAEAPHILAWMVEGCIKWQRDGLANAPPAIESATAEYREDQDIVGRWLEECTKRDQHGEETTAVLYESYHRWCLGNGLRPASTVVLGRRLGERGFSARKTNGKRLWTGLTLNVALKAEIGSYVYATKGR